MNKGIIIALVLVVVLIIMAGGIILLMPATTTPSDNDTSTTKSWRDGDYVAATGTSVYFIENNTKRQFASANIYQSYGSPAYKTIPLDELNAIPMGSAMPFKTTNGLPAGFANGDVIVNTNIYWKIDGGKRRKFPSNAVYVTWGSPVAKPIDAPTLAAIPTGDDMTFNVVNGLPGGVTNNTNVRNTGNMGIYHISGSKARWYPNGLIYQSYGSPSFVDVPQEIFNLIPLGDPMPNNSTPPPPQPGATWTTVGNYGDSLNLVSGTQVRYGTTIKEMPHGDFRCIASNFGLANETMHPCEVMSWQVGNATKYTTLPAWARDTAGRFMAEYKYTNGGSIPTDLQAVGVGPGRVVSEIHDNSGTRWFINNNRARRWDNCTTNANCTQAMSNGSQVIPLSAAQRRSMLEGAKMQ